MRFGELAWLAHRGGCPQGCAHTERLRRQVAKSSRERQWQDMRGKSSPLQHMQRAGTQSGGTEGCITQERQRQCAASHKSVVHCTGNRHHSRMGSGRLHKFAQVCSWRNVPHFGQRAVDAKSGGELLDARHVTAKVSEMIIRQVDASQRAINAHGVSKCSDALCSVRSLSIFIEAAQLVV